MDRDYRVTIDHFIRNIPSKEAEELLWKLIKTVKEAYDIRQSPRFNIPSDRLRNSGVNDQDKKLLIQQLDENRIVSVFLTASITDPKTNAPRIEKRIPLQDFPEIITDPLAEIILEHPFFYLYEKLKMKWEKPTKLTFKWIPQYQEHRGILYINDEEITFRSGRFGGVDILLDKIDHDVTTDELRKAILSHSQGSNNSLKIDISQWKNDLINDRKQFGMYFVIEFFRPNFHRLSLK